MNDIEQELELAINAAVSRVCVRHATLPELDWLTALAGALSAKLEGVEMRISSMELPRKGRGAGR